MYKLYKKVHTRDGHVAYIYKKRNAILLFRFRYYIYIMQKHVAHGDKQDTIYGWVEATPDKAVKAARAWTMHVLFKKQAYLVAAAVSYNLAHPS